MLVPERREPLLSKLATEPANANQAAADFKANVDSGEPDVSVIIAYRLSH